MKRITTLALALVLLLGAVALPSAGEDAGLRAIDDTTIVVAGDLITRIAGIPTAAELKAQLASDGDIEIEGVADGELVPNGTAVKCGGKTYFAVISGDVQADAKLNARDVIALLRLIVSGETAESAADANLDGAVNSKDVITLMKYIVGLKTPGFVAEAADFNGDGKVNSKDVIALMKYIVSK